MGVLPEKNNHPIYYTTEWFFYIIQHIIVSIDSCNYIGIYNIFFYIYIMSVTRKIHTVIHVGCVCV